MALRLVHLSCRLFILQAIFEIMTSEHSYLHSLGILVSHFKSNEALRKTMTATEHHHLFSNISVIRDVSQRYAQHSEKPLCVFVFEMCSSEAERCTVNARF